MHPDIVPPAVHQPASPVWCDAGAVWEGGAESSLTGGGKNGQAPFVPAAKGGGKALRRPIRRQAGAPPAGSTRRSLGKLREPRTVLETEPRLDTKGHEFFLWIRVGRWPRVRASGPLRPGAPTATRSPGQPPQLAEAREDSRRRRVPRCRPRFSIPPPHALSAPMGFRRLFWCLRRGIPLFRRLFPQRHRPPRGRRRDGENRDEG